MAWISLIILCSRALFNPHTVHSFFAHLGSTVNYMAAHCKTFHSTVSMEVIIWYRRSLWYHRIEIKLFVNITITNLNDNHILYCNWMIRGSLMIYQNSPWWLKLLRSSSFMKNAIISNFCKLLISIQHWYRNTELFELLYPQRMYR